MDIDARLEKMRVNRAVINTRRKKIVKDAMKAAERVIENIDGPNWLMIEYLAKAFVAKAKRTGPKPLGRKNIFDTGVPSRQVDIEVMGRQGFAVGDIRIKGWLIKVNGQHVIIKVPQKNIKGWIIKKSKTV